MLFERVQLPKAIFVGVAANSAVIIALDNMPRDRH